MLTPAFLISFFLFFQWRYDIEKQLALVIFFSIFVTLGYVVEISGSEVSYAHFYTMLIVTISLVGCVDNKSFNTNHLIKVTLLITSLFLSYLMVTVFDTESIKVYANGKDYADDILSVPIFGTHNIKDIFNLIFFLFFAMLLGRRIGQRTINYIMISGRFILILLVLEFISKNVFSSTLFLDLSKIVFGEGMYQIDFIFERAGFSTLQGLTREPNQLAKGLFIWGLVAIYNKNNKDTPYIFLVLAILLFSGSLAGIGFSLFLALALIIVHFKIKFIAVFPVFLSLFVFTLYKLDITYYISRLDSIYDDSRIISIVHSFSVFGSAPIFGVGLGNSMSFGTVSTLLSNLGLVGTLLWFSVLIHGHSYDRKASLIIALFVIASIITGGKGSVYAVSTIFLFASLAKREAH